MWFSLGGEYNVIFIFVLCSATESYSVAQTHLKIKAILLPLPPTLQVLRVCAPYQFCLFSFCEFAEFSKFYAKVMSYFYKKKNKLFQQ